MSPDATVVVVLAYAAASLEVDIRLTTAGGRSPRWHSRAVRSKLAGATSQFRRPSYQVYVGVEVDLPDARCDNLGLRGAWLDKHQDQQWTGL